MESTKHKITLYMSEKLKLKLDIAHQTPQIKKETKNDFICSIIELGLEDFASQLGIYKLLEEVDDEQDILKAVDYYIEKHTK